MEYNGGAPLWPLVAYAALVFLIIAVMLGLSAILGLKRKATKATNEPYESGVVSVGSAHARVPIPFFLVAIFFVIFDLEAVFLYAWAVSAVEVGWLGYIEVVVFISILVAALVYVWKLGALDWRTPRQRELHQLAKRYYK